MVLLLTFSSPGPYPFYLFYFVIFYIDSSFFFPSQMSYMIYLDGVAIYFLISKTLSIISFLHCCLFQLTPIFFFPLSIHYLYYPDCAAIDFLISNTPYPFYLFLCCLLHWHFFFLSISNVLYNLTWWCCYRFSYLQDLIHSIFSTLLSYTIDSSFYFHLEYITK